MASGNMAQKVCARPLDKKQRFEREPNGHGLAARGLDAPVPRYAWRSILSQRPSSKSPNDDCSAIRDSIELRDSSLHVA
eukprot:6732609-Pyramimonas_sp.AAC.1